MFVKSTRAMIQNHLLVMVLTVHAGRTSSTYRKRWLIRRGINELKQIDDKLTKNWKSRLLSGYWYSKLTEPCFFRWTA